MSLLLLLGSAVVTSGEAVARPNSRTRTYVQGSSVKIWVDILDAATMLPVEDLADVTALVQQPDGTIEPFEAGEIETDELIPGRYSCIVDTTTLAGQWVYQFATSGEDAVVAKARFHVREAITA